MKRIFQLFLFISSPLTCFAQHSVPGVLSISFQHELNGKAIALDSGHYQNSLGQSYTITNFKYYISNIELTAESGKKTEVPGYFLIEEDEPNSKLIQLTGLPAEKFTYISFLVGVDSTHNCSGAQSGALDPANAMFWAWNTGYIFLKIEGKSPQSTAPGHVFEYHLGGYAFPNNNLRRIDLELPDTTSASKELILHVNIAELFEHPNTLDFTIQPSITDAKRGKILADNITDMFTITPAKHEN